MHEVVRQQQHLKEGHIGDPVLRGDLAQRIIVEEFSDILLDGGALGIELPGPPGMGFQIGDQDMVGIFSVFEEGQLLGLDGIVGDGAPHHDKPMGAFPSMRLVLELSHFPPIAKLFETACSGPGLDRGIFFGHNRIATVDRIEKFDYPPAKEARIGPDTNAGSGNGLGSLGQTGLQKRHRPGTAGSISGTQSAMPEFLEMGLEAQKRMIGSSSPFLGVVAHFGELGLSVNRQHHGIQIEDQRGSGFGQDKQPCAELIVQGNELADRLGREPLEESSQGGLIGKPRKTQQGEKGAIVLQDLGLVDAVQACHDRIEKSQDHIGRKIVDIAVRNLDILLE